MAGQKMLTDANRRLSFVTSLANYHAPKVATELNAVGALDLSLLITAANFNLGASGDDEIKDPAYAASANTSVPGRTNYVAEMEAYRWKTDVDDKAWTTFTAKGIHGFLVERIGQIADGEKAHEIPFAVADELRVFEVITGTPQVLSPSGAGYEKFKITFHVQELVDERAIAAT